MKIYTKTGDDGTTGLFGGKRVSKNDVRVCAYGDVDTLNSAIGLACVYMENEGLQHTLQGIQSALFQLGAELATDPEKKDKVAITPLTSLQTAALEKEIDKLEAELPPLKNFILPGGRPAASQLHLARSLCRQAERSMLTLHHEQALRPEVLQYINRLSDFLFVAARYCNHLAGVADIVWQG